MRKRDKGGATADGSGNLRRESRPAAAEGAKGGATADGSGNLQRESRPTAAEGAKGGATADGSGNLRRAPRPTAASSHRSRHPPQLPQPPSVTSPFEAPAATVRNTLRRPPQPPSVTSPLSLFRIGVNMPTQAHQQFGAHLGFGLRWSGSGSRF